MKVDLLPLYFTLHLFGMWSQDELINKLIVCSLSNLDLIPNFALPHYCPNQLWCPSILLCSGCLGLVLPWMCQL